MLCACNQLFCVYNSCRINENNLSDSNTRCPILKVHMWDIMFEREEYLHSFWKSGVPMANHPYLMHLRVFKSSITFKRLSLKQIKYIFLEGGDPT